MGSECSVRLSLMLHGIPQRGVLRYWDCKDDTGFFCSRMAVDTNYQTVLLKNNYKILNDVRGAEGGGDYMSITLGLSSKMEITKINLSLIWTAKNTKLF